MHGEEVSRGSRQKRASPGPDFVRAAMAWLVPSATRTQIDRAMRLSKTDLLTAMYGLPGSARRRRATKGAAKNRKRRVSSRP